MRKLTLSGLAILLALGPSWASACATLEPVQQRKLDQVNLQAERDSALGLIRQSDLIFVGSVSALQRPEHVATSLGQVTLQVIETLKGSSPGNSITLPWKSNFIISCESAAMFNNVGFAQSQSYLIYVSDGSITRSAGTTRSAYAGALSFEVERAMILKRSDR